MQKKSAKSMSETVTCEGRTYEEFHGDGRWFFLRVMRANTMCSRVDAVCFYSRSLPKSRPTLRISSGGTALHVTRTPFTNHATDTLFVGCLPNRDVTPRHASDNTNITTIVVCRRRRLARHVPLKRRIVVIKIIGKREWKCMM